MAKASNHASAVVGCTWLKLFLSNISDVWQ